MPNFTLVLDHKTADRIRELATRYGASVGGFAAAHIIDLAELPDEEIERVRREVRQLANAERRHPRSHQEPRRTP